jgi:hypothetical protein
VNEGRKTLNGCMTATYLLVGGDLTILKNMKVNGVGIIPYMKWKIKNV